MTNSPMKLGLSTYWNSPRHWSRLVEFARTHRVDRLVYSPQYIGGDHWLFPQYPSLLTEDEKQRRRTCREHLANAARLTTRAGMEFWFYYVVLMIPKADEWRTIAPDLFTPDGEPDMANPKIYELLSAQIDELLEIAPQLTGLELWIEEGAAMPLSRLKHQSWPIEKIIERMVETVHAKCVRHGLKLDIDLHVGGGHRPSVEAILASARKRPDIIVSADSTIGDFHLHLPFNQHLWRAAVTNPVQVHFDVNGEYWGRNMYPTCALAHYVSHLNEARALGATCVNGRVMAAVDGWVPYANVLPSRRHFYPELAGLRVEDPIPKGLEICCFDTLGAFNAEFFCRCTRDPSTDPRAVVSEFLKTEFGADLPELVDVLLDTESVAARVFYAGQNYFGAQSTLPGKGVADFFACAAQFVTASGELLPLPLQGDCAEWGKESHFIGWPISAGRSAGPHALIAEKQEALRDVRDLLTRAERATATLPLESRSFILRHFEDFVSYAEAATLLLEAMVHYYHLCAKKQNRDIPNREHLAQVLQQMLALANVWEKRQPQDEWRIATTLREWHRQILKLGSAR